ncbi:MAG: alpha-galactosidase [Microbacteriaceae bacterium]|nr:alpha-galactosidase [Microbacteriaceae bacterium]MCL2795932.1 alpha-galactosidase [Microbacteriaceae bacterium]
MSSLLHLAAGRVSVVIDATPGGLGEVLHWGPALEAADLEALALTAAPAVAPSSYDRPRRLGLLPVGEHGWAGTPGFEARRGERGERRAEALALAQAVAADSGAEARLVFANPSADIRVTVDLALAEGGVLRACASARNDGGDPLAIDALRVLLPVPQRARELLDFTGSWTSERMPQRRPLTDGTHLRAARRGRPGHDSPLLTVLGTPGFGNGAGELWSAHVGWSGDTEYLAERLQEGAGSAAAVIGGGAHLAPGEIVLAPGEVYDAPAVYFAHTGDGLDGIAAAHHAWLRARPHHPSTPRPLTLNSWEAMYFDLTPDRLIEFAEAAAALGVERVVIDDGWFGGRRDDRRGLGDWQVSDAVWHGRFVEVADRVHALGLQLGIWFEPEMVNLDSDLARAHPEWILGRLGAEDEWRHQLTLDLSNPEVVDYLLESIDTVVTAAGIDYIKWDMNREVSVTVDQAARPTGTAQVRALYGLLAELRRRHPALEIESCASGGARVDLGMLEHTQRVWASDSNDPVDRAPIQRGTSLLLAPELIGAHVGPEYSHTTDRATALSYRLATALFGHAGIEWDVTKLADAELDALREWGGLYRRLRPLLHGGRTVAADELDEGELLHGVVSHARDHAVLMWGRTTAARRGSTPRTRVPGLDPARRYAISLPAPAWAVGTHDVTWPGWWAPLVAGETVELPGRVLAEAGVPLPRLNAQQAVLIELRAV